MTQILTTKGRSLMLMVLFALSLAVLIVLSGAASRAEAQDVSATNTVLQQLEDDGKLNSDMKEELEMWNRIENSSGAATATPTALPTATPTASPSALPSAPATTASPSASAAGEQYSEPLPDTGGETAAPAQTGKAEEVPDTGGRAAAPAETTEATGLPEPNRNSSALPLMLGAGALLVGGGLLARRLIR
jgi:hypothetical protein